MITVTRDEFRAAIEAGIAESDPSEVETARLREIAESAEMVDVLFADTGNGGCPGSQAMLYEPTLSDFAHAYDTHLIYHAHAGRNLPFERHLRVSG